MNSVVMRHQTLHQLQDFGKERVKIKAQLATSFATGPTNDSVCVVLSHK